MTTAATRPADPQYQSALEQYGAAMKWFSQQKFERAKPLLEKLQTCPYLELADRATLHLSACNGRLNHRVETARSGEELYLHAVVRLNSGQYGEAEELLTKAMRAGAQGAHVTYALACLRAQTNDVEAALTHLREAVNADPHCRVLARQDRDLAGLIDDPRFTEILYPESVG